MRVLCLLLVAFATPSIDATLFEVTKPTEWWQTIVLYEIWPRSYKDSDGDGIGDLNGVTDKMEHFVDMGVGAIWLTPFFTSPLVDSGYDVANYVDVNPTYGTLDDFKALLTKAEELGIKVIIDFVPNHTSDQHEWFVKSKAGIEPYTDYYVWNEGILDANGTRQPPNNWVNVFNSGSAWKWVDSRNAYYLHQFSDEQIELNLTNPLVIQETKDILKFWLDYGVDGIRIDAVPFFVEDPLLRDEPLSNAAGFTVGEWGWLNHTRVLDNLEDYKIIQIWSDYIKNYTATANDTKVRIICTETYATIEKVVDYYNYGSEVSFNFFGIKENIVTDVHLYEANDILNYVSNWMTYMPANKTANWVLGNHDNNRIASKYGEKRVDALNMLLYMLPGVAVNFQGDEMGMPDTTLTWAQTEDPRACSTNENQYTLYSRDPVRTPYQWDNSTSAGFSTNATTMLPVNPNYLTFNLAAQKAADVSIYKNVQALIALRNTTVLKEGSLNVEVIGDDVFAFTRELKGEIPIVVLMNWSNTTDATFCLDVFEDLPDTLEVLVADIYSGIKVGDIYNSTSIYLPKYAAVVLQGIDSE